MTPSPLAKKMHLKEGYRVAMLHAPPTYREMLEPTPDGVQIDERLDGKYDWIWHFAHSRADLERDIEVLRAAATANTPIWLSYRKGTRQAPSDLKRETMWEVAGPAGLQPNAQIAVDEIWSALRFKVVEVGTQPLIAEEDLSVMSRAEHLPLPPSWTQTSTGEPMPDWVSLLRRSRASH